MWQERDTEYKTFGQKPNSSSLTIFYFCDSNHYRYYLYFIQMLFCKLSVIIIILLISFEHIHKNIPKVSRNMISKPYFPTK